MSRRTRPRRKKRSRDRSLSSRRSRSGGSAVCRRLRACNGWILNLIGVVTGAVIILLLDHVVLPSEDRWRTLPMVTSAIVNVNRGGPVPLRVAQRRFNGVALHLGGGADGIDYGEEEEDDIDELTAELAHKFGLHAALEERSVPDGRRSAVLGDRAALRGVGSVTTCSALPEVAVVLRTRAMLSATAPPHRTADAAALTTTILGERHSFTTKQRHAVAEFCHGKHSRRNAVINLLNRRTNFGKHSLQELPNAQLKRYARWHAMERLERFLILFELILNELPARMRTEGRALQHLSTTRSRAAASPILIGFHALNVSRDVPLSGVPPCVRCASALDVSAIAAFTKAEAALLVGAAAGPGGDARAARAPSPTIGAEARDRVVAAVAVVDALKQSKARAGGASRNGAKKTTPLDNMREAIRAASIERIVNITSLSVAVVTGLREKQLDSLACTSLRLFAAFEDVLIAANASGRVLSGYGNASVTATEVRSVSIAELTALMGVDASAAALMSADELLPLATQSSLVLATSARFLREMGLAQPWPKTRTPAATIAFAAEMLGRLTSRSIEEVRMLDGRGYEALRAEVVAMLGRLRHFLIGTHKITPKEALSMMGDDVKNGAVDHLNRLTGVAVPVIQMLDLPGMLDLSNHALTCVTMYRDFLLAIGEIPSAAAFTSSVNTADARDLVINAIHKAAAIPWNISTFKAAKASVIDRVIAVENIRRATARLGSSSGVSLVRLRKETLPSLRRIATAQLARVRHLPLLTIQTSARTLYNLAKQASNASQQVADLGNFVVSMGTMSKREARAAKIADLTDAAVLEICRVLKQRASKSVASALGRSVASPEFEDLRALPLQDVWHLAVNLTDHSKIEELEQAALKQKEDIVLDGLRRFLAAMEVLPMVKLMKMKRNDLRNTGIDRIHAVSKIEIPILQGLRIDELSKTAAEHIPKDSKYATPSPKLLGGDDGEGRGEGDGYGYGEDGVDDVDEDYEDFRSLFKSGDDASAEAKKLNKVTPTAASMGAPQAAEQDVLAKAAALLSAETHDAALPPPVSTPPPPNLRRRSWRDLQLER